MVENLGHYRILGKLGQGGMGVVYKALDTRLDRPVAVKILPPDKVADPERKRRFVQEAKAASALNHPNIVTIYDIGSDSGMDYLAMEYVTGKTLDDLIPRQGMRLNELLRIAIQIADGLAKAHSAGITHRDLKPANIMVDGDGHVKLLDFGLAKLTDHAPPTEHDATLTKQHTDEGAIVGTVSYMSPEQAEGKKIDTRSDIFSFGAVLYEMVSGQRAFQDDTPMSTLAAVLQKEPKPLAGLTPAIPRDLDKIITRCLRKSPDRRFHVLVDVKIALEELKEESESGKLNELPPSATTRKLPRVAWIGIPLVAALAVTARWLWYPQATALPPAGPRVTPLTSYSGIEGHPTFSPDAGQVAFHWNGEKQDNFDIYVKVVGSSAPPLRLTNQPVRDWAPEWSPDGKSIAFIRSPGPSGAVVLIPALGGPERKLCDTKGDSLSWHPDGKRIAIMDRASSSEPYHIAIVDLETGGKKALTRPGKDYVGDGAPAFSPDGETLAFSRWRIRSGGDLHTLDLRDGREKPLPLRSSSLRLAWTPDSRAIVAGDSLVPLDGSPVRLLQGVRVGAEATVSKGRLEGEASLAFVDRTEDQNIWRKDLQPPGPSQQIIASTRLERFPKWSPNGSRIAFASSRSGTPRIWLSDANGGGLVELGTDGRVNGWSPDGTQILLDGGRKGGSSAADIFVLGVDGGAPRNLTNSPSDEVRASWSQDGATIFFRSNRSGRNEIWRMPALGGDAFQVTKNGGSEAQDSPDGKLLYVVKNSADRLRSTDSTHTSAPGGLWTMPVAGGQETLLIPSVTAGYWCVTTPGIVYVDLTKPPDSRDPKPVLFYDFATRRTTQVATIEKGLESAFMNFSVTRDGRRMIWAQIDQESADIMLIQGWKP